MPCGHLFLGLGRARSVGQQSMHMPAILAVMNAVVAAGAEQHTQWLFSHQHPAATLAAAWFQSSCSSAVGAHTTHQLLQLLVALLCSSIHIEASTVFLVLLFLGLVETTCVSTWCACVKETGAGAVLLNTSGCGHLTGAAWQQACGDPQHLLSDPRP